MARKGKTQHGRDLSGAEMAEMLDEFCNGSGRKDVEEFVASVSIEHGN